MLPVEPERQQNTYRRAVSGAAPLVLPLLAAVVLRLNWGSIPQSFPVHWGLDGRPNGWGTRSIVGVFWPLGLAVFVIVLLAAAGAAGRLSAGQRSARESGLARSVPLLVAWFVAFLISAVSLMPLAKDPATFVPWVVAGALLFGLGMVGVAIYRARRTPPAPVGTRAHWHALGLYSNAADPAVWVPKRSGLGWTLNFARPVAWVIMAGLVLIALVPFLFVHRR